MEVIPVIDLKDGAVVRARLGRREFYAPIESRLAATSGPADIVAGLLSLHPFATIYIADLNAIDARGDHEDVLFSLEEAFPQVGFWVDAGVKDAGEARSWLLRHKRATLVLGTETLGSSATLEILKDEERIILSLDFRGETFIGPEALLSAQHIWPSRVIAMTLGRIGANAGPDLSRIASLKALSDRKVYAAGGVRGTEDLAALDRAGVDGALVASALHDGQLTSQELAAPIMAKGIL
ncbi:HisA/HisF-related TIM barrel protein [Methylocella silvestris]|uniref:Nickel transporter n=1 Tax=Methylocella silvestris TaxID=199596 RepID=A0A2J7TH89_METSI|nr:HisA/HisF-related TIM barrel protein [Methylocella silvestris]PNG26119.1 nickel transporter [Methylocella silvestris]